MVDRGEDEEFSGLVDNVNCDNIEIQGLPRTPIILSLKGGQSRCSNLYLLANRVPAIRRGDWIKGVGYVMSGLGDGTMRRFRVKKMDIRFREEGEVIAHYEDPGD